MNMEERDGAFSESTMAAGVVLREPELTVADLLSAPGLGLRQLAGRDAATVPLRGAHAIEVENPSRWLPAHWAVLMTGLRLRGDPPAQRALVRELAEAGMAALCYSTGTTTRTVPPALVDEARRRDFPLLSVPLKTPLHRIVDYVHTVRRHDDPDIMQLLVGSRLAHGGADRAAASEPAEPIEAGILRRLEQASGIPVALLDASGVWVWKPGMRPLPPAVLRRLQATATGEITEIDIDGRVWRAVPVRRDGRPTAAWLLFAAEPHVPADALTRIWAAVNIVTFVYEIRERAPANVVALRAQLLFRLVHDTGDPADTEERMRRLGFTMRRPLRVVLTDPADAPAVRTALQASDTPYLRLTEPARTVFCVEAAGDVLDGMLRGAVAHRAAVGSPAPAVDGVAGSLRAAEFVWASAAVSEPRVARWDDVGPAGWLLTTADPSARREWAERWLRPLARQPLLLDAVTAYLVHDQDVGAAAAALRLHPNSLRYRLGRAEQVLGRGLRQAAVVADLYVALAATERL